MLCIYVLFLVFCCLTSLVLDRTVSGYCSACVSHDGLSTKKTTEPYSDNLLNRTRNASEEYLDNEIPLRRALRRLSCWSGSQVKIHQKSALSQLGSYTKPYSDTSLVLEAQQRYFSCRKRTVIARYVAKWGIELMCQ